MIVNLYAGPGGWCRALVELGRESIGIEWDAAACATRAAVGYPTIRADIGTYPTGPFHDVEGLIASPPVPRLLRRRPRTRPRPHPRDPRRDQAPRLDRPT